MAESQDVMLYVIEPYNDLHETVMKSSLQGVDVEEAFESTIIGNEST